MLKVKAIIANILCILVVFNMGSATKGFAADHQQATESVYYLLDNAFTRNDGGQTDRVQSVQSELYIRNTNSGGAHRDGYIKVKCEDLVERDIVSAKLYLYAHQWDTRYDAQNGTLTVYALKNKDWIESEVKWTNKPDETAGINQVATFEFMGVEKWHEIDLTEALQNEGDKILSLKIVGDSNKLPPDDSQPRYKFRSRAFADETLRPYLKVVSVPHTSLKFRYKDAEGNSVTDYTYAKSAKVITDLLDADAQDNEGVLLVGLYDQNGIMKDFAAEYGVAKTVTAELTDLPDDYTNHYIKTFLWRDFNSFNPFAKSVISGGTTEFSQAGMNSIDTSIRIDGSKIAISGISKDQDGQAKANDNIGLAIIKPDKALDENAHLNLATLKDSVSHIYQVETDDNGYFSLNATMADNLSSGYYTARIGGNTLSTVDYKFYYVNLNNQNGLANLLQEISTMNDTDDCLAIMDSYNKVIGLNESSIYNAEYISMNPDEKKSIIQKVLNADTFSTTESLYSYFERATALQLVDQSEDWLSLSFDIRDYFDILGISNSYYNRYINLADTDRSAIVKEVFENRHSYNNNLADISTFKSTFEDLVDEKEGQGQEDAPRPSKRKKTTVTSSIVVMPSLTPSPTPVVNKITFGDLQGFEWAENSINNLVNKGVLSGYEDGTFKPDQNVTREQFIKMLIGALKLYDENSVCSFGDVEKGAWYYPYIASAEKLQIVKGNSNGLFGVGSDITRQEMAVIAHRAMNLASISLPQNTNGINFSDADKIDEYAKEPVSIMQKANVIKGITDSEFGPKQNANRAQAAVILDRLLEIKSSIEGGGK